MGREWGKSSCWGCWGTQGRRQRNCGLAVWVWQKGGGVGSRLWGWKPWEKSGKHCHNLWKLWRKVLLHIVIIPLMSFDQKCLVMVTLWHGYWTHWSRNSSHWIHWCCTGEMPTLVSASWWKQKDPEVKWHRKWQRLWEHSVLGKMHTHFLKNLINKRYAAYYNDSNAISDRLLHLPITAWKKIYQKKWVGQWKITPTNSGFYLLNLVNRPFSRGRNAIEIH